MKNDFKNSFDKVRPSEGAYYRIYNKVLNSKKKKSNLYIYSAIAAAVFIVVLISISFLFKDSGITEIAAEPTQATAEEQAENKIAYKVVLSLNPDVEFSVDENDMLVEVKGLNEDGAKLIEGIDFYGLSLENGTIIVVNQLIISGYISAYSTEREIQLYFSENSDLDALDVMSGIIEAGTGGYNLNSAQNRINEKSLSIRYWSGQEEEEVPVPAESVSKMTLKYEMHNGYIGMIDVIINDDEKLAAFIDCPGMETEDATLYFFEELFEKDYIRSDVQLEYVFDSISEAKFNDVAELVEALASYHGLKVKGISSYSDKSILMTYDDIDITPAETKYTILQILNPMLIKTEDDITAAQMEILRMCFTEDELLYELKPRIFVVVPNIEGLSEDTALYLLNLAGITPRRVEEEYDSNWAPSSQNPLYNLNYLNMVIAQDVGPGGTYEQGMNFMYWVLVNEVEEADEINNEQEIDENNAEQNSSIEDDGFFKNIFEIYGESCLDDITRVTFEEKGSDRKSMEISGAFTSELKALLSDMYFAVPDFVPMEASADNEKFYFTITTEQNSYYIIIYEREDEYIAYLGVNFLSTDLNSIMKLIEMGITCTEEDQLSYEDILAEFYTRIEYAAQNPPDALSAERYYIASERTRIDAWDTNFTEINGSHDVIINYESIQEILKSIALPSPVSAYRSIELIDVEGGFFSDVEYINNTGFRAELIYEDFFIHIYADHNTLYLRSKVNGEWYTAMVTDAASNYIGVHLDFITMLASEEALPTWYEHLDETTSISIYYVKQEDSKDYPENGALSVIKIDDSQVIDNIVSSINNTLTPINPYPSRENADIVFHTPNGDIWAKIKNPIKKADDQIEWILTEATIIFDGYYWFENAKFYEILFDSVE